MVSEVQAVLLELLKEIDDICKKEGISYYLCEDTALSARIHGEFFPDCCEAKVAMTPDNYKTFEKAVKKLNRPDRTLESMKNNGKYSEFGARYGARDTMMLSLRYDQPLLYPDLGVVIRMIRYKPSHLSKLYHLSNIFSKYRNRSAESVAGRAKKLFVKCVAMMQKLIGYDRISRMLFAFWSYGYTRNTKGNKLSIGQGEFAFNYSVLSAASDVELCGYTFPALDESYLEKVYGEDYANADPSYPKASIDLLVSAVLPFEKYREAAAEIIDWEQFYNDQRAHDEIYSKAKKYSKKINRYYAIVERTEKRYAMYEKYMPMKAQILEMARNEQYDELNECLAPFRSVIYKFYKKKLGICFDKEIFDVTMMLLEREGRHRYAKKVRSLVPDEYWKPMVIKNYRGEEITC